VQVRYQAGNCGDTENERSSDGCAYRFALRCATVCGLKHQLLQEGLQEFIGHSDLETRQAANFPLITNTNYVWRSPFPLIESEGGRTDSPTDVHPSI
jgi:hypothetical protein